MTAGTLVGVAAGVVALSLVTVALWALFGMWGLLGSAGLWALVSVLLIDPEVMYARSA